MRKSLAMKSMGVIVASAVTIGLSGFAYAEADELNAADGPSVEFGALDDASYAEVFDAIVASNDSDTAAEFFAEASEDPAAVELPGLHELSTAEKREVLDASAEAADEGQPLPLQDLPPAVASEDDSSVTASTAGARTKLAGSVVTPAFALTNASGQRAPGVVKRASYASAAVSGGAINSRRSWQMSNRYNWTECTIFSCKVTSWLDFRFTTDPGRSSSRTSVNFTKWGTKIGNVQVNSWVFAAGSNYGASGWKTWNTPGNGTQYNYHNSTLNKSFQGWYEVRIGRPGGTQAFEFKTGKSATCREPSPAAYQCVF